MRRACRAASLARGGRLVALAALLLSPLLVPRLARAAPAQIALDYQRDAAAESCPETAALEAAVAVRLGYDPFVDAAPHHLVVRVSRAGRAWSATVAQASGERRLVAGGDDCSELAGELVLTMCLAIDASASQPAPPPLATAAPSAAPSPSPAQADDDEQPGAKPPLPPEQRLRLHTRLGAVVVGDAAPSVAVGIVAAAGVERGNWAVSAELRGDVPTRADARQGSFLTSLGVLWLVPCVTDRFMSACLLVGGGAQVASGSGYLMARTSLSPYLALGARAAADIQIYRAFGLRLQFDLVVPLIHTLLLVGDFPVFSTPSVAVSMATLLQLKFW